MKLNEKTTNPLNPRNLAVPTLSADFDMERIISIQKVNAAVVNISGRQRMLSQRSAFLALHLVWSQDSNERQVLKQELQAAIDLMARSHKGLIEGNSELDLPGYVSPQIHSLYFEPPLQVDQQVHQYILAVRALLQCSDEQLDRNNPHLQHILKAASGLLLQALDTVVSQYQHESDAQHQELASQQVELYQQTYTAAATAQAQAQQLEQTLHQLKNTQAQLVQTEKMSSLGQLVAGVAHEINNPVNFIYGNVEHANEYTQDILALLKLYQQHYPQPDVEIQEQADAIDIDFLAEDLPKMLGSMKMGANRIRQIVLSLRNFSRLDEAEMKDINIHEGIDSTLLILQSRLKARPDRPDIQIIKEYDNLPLIECYAGQLNQVFMNILSNAIDALEGCGTETPTEFDNPKIWIRTEVINSDRIAITIRDNGPGISPETRERLFEPFFTTKPIGKGTGLGLSISYQVVTEKHGGTLVCRSQPDQGTEFLMELPIYQTQN